MSTLVSVDWRVEGILSHYFPLFFLPEFFSWMMFQTGLVSRVFPAPVKTMVIQGLGWCRTNAFLKPEVVLLAQYNTGQTRLVPCLQGVGGGAPASHHGLPPVGTIWWLVWCQSPTSCVPHLPLWIPRAQLPGQGPGSTHRAWVEQKPGYTDQRLCFNFKPSVSS